MANEPKMKFEYEDNGFCRVVFSRHEQDYSTRYCWQLDGPETFTFLRCSRDDEPSHEVLGWGGVLAEKLTPKNPGQTAIGQQLNAFLDL